MKVVQVGKKHPSRRLWKGTCRECESVMVETEKDLPQIKHEHVEPSGDPREHSYDYAEMECPICQTSFRMVRTSEYAEVVKSK